MFLNCLKDNPHILYNLYFFFKIIDNIKLLYYYHIWIQMIQINPKHTKDTPIMKRKTFLWSVTSTDKPLSGTIACQEQCSSGNGGNGKCGTGK